MALGIPTDQRGQILALLILVALAGGYFFWTKKNAPAVEQIRSREAEDPVVAA